MKFTRLQKLLAILFLLSLYPAFAIISLDVLPRLRRWWNAETIAAISEFTSECRKGREFYSGNNWDSSIASYTRAIELLPESLAKEGNTVRHHLMTGYYSRGLAYKRKTNSDKALADFTEAIRLCPIPEAYIARGQVHNTKKEYDKAIADFTEAIRMRGNAYNAFYGRARAYSGQGNTAKAEADRAEAFKLELPSLQRRLAPGKPVF